MLDADADADHLRPNARIRLLFGRHLAVRSGRRVTGERFGVADVHEALDELQSVIKDFPGLEPALDPEGERGARAFRQILLRELVMGAGLQARVG